MRNALLSNFDIIELSEMLKIPLIDIVSKDTLLTMTPQSGCYVINLEDSGGLGTHWVCLILGTYVSYFDPFGLYPSEDVSLFISWYMNDKKKMDIIYSSSQIQDMDSILCGWYCLYFMYFHAVLHNDNHDNKYLMSKHNKMFKRVGFNTKINDNILQQLIKNVFT